MQMPKASNEEMDKSGDLGIHHVRSLCSLRWVIFPYSPAEKLVLQKVFFEVFPLYDELELRVLELDSACRRALS